MSSNSPKPFVFSASQSWDGIDGSWSTFIVRVGNPPQIFRVLPSTTLNQVWVPAAEGCQAPDDNDDCAKGRGVFPFDGHDSLGFMTNRSTTYKSINLFNLIPEHKLPGYSGNGLFGYDTIGTTISEGLKIDDQVFAAIATKDFYLGVFGLGVKPSNFSGFEHPQPSFLSNARTQGLIPSLSYGYTAGAAYKVPKSLGSLVLGGYDRAKYVADSTTPYPFNTDDSRILNVVVRGITTTDSLNGAATLLNDSIASVIDSTTPYLWLPKIVCDTFQSAFGLSYDSEENLYLLNETTRTRLREQNPEVHIAIGSEDDPSTWTHIRFPYGAFDLQTTQSPFVNGTNMFPLRRANSALEYTLGRAFLQEAYLIVDYERSTFSVNQVTDGQASTKEDIVSILPPDADINNPGSPPPTNDKQHSISKSAVAGIVSGSVIGALLLILILYYFWRRKQATTGITSEVTTTSEIDEPTPSAGAELSEGAVQEMEQTPLEMEGSKPILEIETNEHYLISDDSLQHEADC